MIYSPKLSGLASVYALYFGAYVYDLVKASAAEYTS